jgi:hypothetical protein
MAFWMSLFVSHPNQKFLQMKYYPLHSGRIKRWAGGYRSSNDFYMINGCKFEQLPILDLQIAKHELKERDTQTEGISIGSISRPEKICDAVYNQFILQLLKANPKLSYLYTGRIEATNLLPETIRKHPRSMGLGWVDPGEAIAKFSIYLEPFPWGGGEMTLLALSAGEPKKTSGLASTAFFDFWLTDKTRCYKPAFVGQKTNSEIAFLNLLTTMNLGKFLAGLGSRSSSPTNHQI